LRGGKRRAQTSRDAPGLGREKRTLPKTLIDTGAADTNLAQFDHQTQGIIHGFFTAKTFRMWGSNSMRFVPAWYRFA
jgi:hypothetical protein